jgi:hypothetical protein
MSDNIFDNYNEVNQYTWETETKRVRSRLLTIAVLFFLSDLLGLLIADMLTVQLILWSLLIPAILGCLAMLAVKEPMSAVVIAMVIVGGVWVYIIAISGGVGAVSGILVKAIVIYLLISAFQSAKAAQRAKKEMLH